ncbi:MAG: family 1 encapsulin nanocompartment shell protein [Thermovirgaceae bacterium]|nr:family 1 encapsulin nanocompartment shell protein [Thermovirgaceae bacterium]
MDMLKRSVSPITDKAWNEIDAQATKVLKSRLSARKFVDVSGPHGWDHAVVSTGRLEVSPLEGGEEVRWGVHLVQPHVETRVTFEMDLRELDNIIRGAKDLRLEPLVDAANRIAAFEENAVYNGFEPGCIVGLSQAGDGQNLSLSAGNPGEIMAGLSEAVMMLNKNAVEGPFVLVAGPRLWHAIDVLGDGYPLKKRISSIVDGGIIFCPDIESGLVASTRGGDFELTLGQDVSIGYGSTMGDKIPLFMAESFTFRVIEPNAVVPLVI